MTTPQQASGGQLFANDPFGSIKNPATNQAPLPEVVLNFHTRADTDSSAQALHHTLGIRNGQSSPGDHKHDGLSSKRLMEGITITGSRGNNIALQNLLANLSNAFGFVDATTP